MEHSYSGYLHTMGPGSGSYVFDWTPPSTNVGNIVFYLAGNKEYAECGDPAYLRAVETYFGAYRSHPAVKMAADLRERKHIWYGSPASFAVHLTPGFQLLPGTRDQAGGGSLDFRWTLAEAQSFARELRSFSRTSRAQGFFNQHAPLYQQLSGRLEQRAAEVRAEWYAELVKPPNSRKFTVVPTLLAGNGNYGPHVQTQAGVHNYAIIGVWKFEGDGSPAFDKDVERIIVHEFAHSYVNPWVDEGMTGLRPAAEALIKARQHDFERTGYGEGSEFSPDLLYETMVRALVVTYYTERGDTTGAERQMQQDIHNGWTWLPSVVDWVKAARASGSFQLDETTRKDYGNLLLDLSGRNLLAAAGMGPLWRGQMGPGRPG